MKKRLYIMIMLELAQNLSACNPNEDDPIYSEVEVPKPNDNSGGENPTPPENINNMKLKITIGLSPIRQMNSKPCCL